MPTYENQRILHKNYICLHLSIYISGPKQNCFESLMFQNIGLPKSGTI